MANVKPATRSSRDSSFVPASIVIAGFAALHVWLALRFPLAPDETYYWEWSRRLAWGYYDQGPMIAWWIRVGCWIFGDSEIGIRAPIIAAFTAYQGFTYLLARDLGGHRVGITAIILAGITPLALAGSFIATYDPLVVLFWSAALYFAYHAIHTQLNIAWFGLGVSLGLGLLTKHTMILFFPCLFLVLLHPENRAWLRRPHPYAIVALAFVIYAPNLIWQTDHQWMTFNHLLTLSGKGTDHGFIRRFGDFLGSQVALITPLLFLGFVASMIWAYRVRSETSRAGVWLLFCSAVPVLLLFLAMTAKSKVQANWPVVGWAAPPILYAVWSDRAGRKARGFSICAIGLCVLMTIFLIVPEARSTVGLTIPKGWDQMNKLYGGRELAAGIEAERIQMSSDTGRPVKLGSTTYDATSRISFYVDGKPQACNLFLGTRKNSYLLWRPNDCPAAGEDMILSDGHAPGISGRPPFELVFERVVPSENPIRVYRGGVFVDPVQTYYLYRCYGYRPNPAVERSARHDKTSGSAAHSP